MPASLCPANLILAVAPVEVGGYISVWKCAVLLVALLIWMRLLTWADKDAEDAHLPRVQLNLGFISGLSLALILFFFLPGFAIAFVAFMFFFIAEIVTYLMIRKN